MALFFSVEDKEGENKAVSNKVVVGTGISTRHGALFCGAFFCLHIVYSSFYPLPRRPFTALPRAYRY